MTLKEGNFITTRGRIPVSIKEWTWGLKGYKIVNRTGVLCYVPVRYSHIRKCLEVVEVQKLYIVDAKEDISNFVIYDTLEDYAVESGYDTISYYNKTVALK